MVDSRRFTGRAFLIGWISTLVKSEWGTWTPCHTIDILAVACEAEAEGFKHERLSNGPGKDVGFQHANAIAYRCKDPRGQQADLGLNISTISSQRSGRHVVGIWTIGLAEAPQ